MKASFFLPIVFLVSCIALSVVGAATYVLYFDTSALIVGERVGFITFSLFLRGFFYSLPFCAVISCLFLIFYLIRHPAHPVISLIVYIIICSAVWLVIIPQSSKIKEKLDLVLEEDKVDNTLSSGYFRPSDKGVSFYLKDSVLFLNFQSRNESDTQFFIDKNPELRISEENIRDPLIKETIKLGTVVSFAFEVLSKVQMYSKEMQKEGLMSYLAFLSMGLAFMSLIGLKRASSWRLLNMSLILTMFVLILILNIKIIFPGNYDFAKKLLEMEFLQKIEIKKILPFILNGFIVLCFTVFGIINVIRRPDPNHRSNR